MGCIIGWFPNVGRLPIPQEEDVGPYTYILLRFPVVTISFCHIYYDFDSDLTHVTASI